MTIVVGIAPEERGRAALHLAAMLARSTGDDLVVCTVVPAPWLAGHGVGGRGVPRPPDADGEGSPGRGARRGSPRT